MRYTVWLRDRQPNFEWPRGLDDSFDGPRLAEELFEGHVHATYDEPLLWRVAYDGIAVRRSQTDWLAKAFWKISSLLLMALGPFALSLWAGLKTWRGVDVHLRLNKIMSIAFGADEVVALLAYVL